MEVKQIATILNAVQGELGGTALIKEDLQGIVEMGTEIFNANAVDNYVKSLMDQVGKMIFAIRKYNGRVPSIVKDAWEFGSVVEKVSFKMPEAIDNEAWNLVDKKSYDPNIFYKPEVTVKFYNNLTTFQVPLSITEMQIKESFQNATQMNSFLSGLYLAVENSITVKTDALVMRTINNMIGEVVRDEYADDTGYATKSGVRAINLLKKYTDQFGAGALKADTATKDPDFLRFMTHEIKLVKSRMAVMSKLYNVGKQDKFTPDDKVRLVMLDDVASGVETYLLSAANQLNNEFIKLPAAETVPYWQAPGTGYEFKDISTIDITTSTNKQVKISGVLGVMFDEDALGVSLFDKRVKTEPNAPGEFVNTWFKQDARYYNDLNENFVVFFVA